MRKTIAAFIGKLSGVLTVVALTASHTVGADSNATAPASVRIGLDRSKEHKFLLQAKAPGGVAWLELDTGAPITCADETKTALFKFQPCPAGKPAWMMMNGQRDRLALVPQMEFGGALTARNFPVVLVDIVGINQAHRHNHDLLDDAILGLDALRRLHAVINFGSRKLFLHTNPASENVLAGWRSVPMRLVDQHLLVPVTLNGAQTLFMVDTGSPSSILDKGLCDRQRIPAGAPGMPIKAIHHEINASIGNIADLQIGSIDLGQTRVAVFDLNSLAGKGTAAQAFTGLIGAQTLERLKAIIDCNAMQLYIKQPGRGGWWEF
jgi:hypothetical protein